MFSLSLPPLSIAKNTKLLSCRACAIVASSGKKVFFFFPKSKNRWVNYESPVSTTAPYMSVSSDRQTTLFPLILEGFHCGLYFVLLVKLLSGGNQSESQNRACSYLLRNLRPTPKKSPINRGTKAHTHISNRLQFQSSHQK